MPGKGGWNRTIFPAGLVKDKLFPAAFGFHFFLRKIDYF